MMKDGYNSAHRSVSESYMYMHVHVCRLLMYAVRTACMYMYIVQCVYNHITSVPCVCRYYQNLFRDSYRQVLIGTH